MKKSGRKILLYLLAIMAIVSFAVIPNVSKGGNVYASVGEATQETLASATTYQGENNWYNFGGDFSKGEFVSMIYRPLDGIWQGQEEFNRIYNGRMAQIASQNQDTMRVKVISKKGVINISGTVERYADENTGTEVTVGIILVKNGDFANPVKLLDFTVLNDDTQSVSLTEGYKIENVATDVSDMIFFIAKATGVKSAGAVFNAKITFTSVESSAIPELKLQATPVKAGEGDVTFKYENDTNSLRDNTGAFECSMKYDNKTGNMAYIYKQPGLNTLYKMDFAGYDAAGWWFTMPSSMNSVGAVWQTKFLSNSANFGYAGVVYTAPLDGVISIAGVTARSSAVEKGDDGAKLGTNEEYALWQAYKVSNGEHTMLASDSILPNQMKYVAEVNGTQNIRVKAGEQVYVLYDCSSPWKFSCMAIAFDYIANPIDTFEGWVETSEITSEEYKAQYSLTQGENDMYYAYGEENKYYLMSVEEGKYAGKDIYASVELDGENITTSVSSAVMRIFKAVGDGKLTLNANFLQTEFYDKTVDFKIYKRAYNGTGYDAAEELFSATTNIRKSFVEKKLTETLNNGDLIIVSAKLIGEKTEGKQVNGKLNVHANYVVQTKKEETSGIGESEVNKQTEYFSDTQGALNWFYAYGEVDNYVLMKYGFGKVNYNAWSGPEWNNRIEKYKLCASPYTGSLLMYVADREGDFIVNGLAQLIKCDGLCPVQATIYKNKDVVWTKDYEVNDYTPENLALTISVNKGDVVSFYVANTKGDTVAYSTEFFYNVEYELVSTSTDIIENKDLINYLNPKKSYAEYLGIQDNYTPQEDQTLSAGKSGCSSTANGQSFILVVALFGVFVVLKKAGVIKI